MVDVLLPSLLAAPVGCTALIVGVAAATDPRLRKPSTPRAMSPVLVVAGAALALGPAVESWWSTVTGAWFGLQVVAMLAAVVVLAGNRRHARPR